MGNTMSWPCSPSAAAAEAPGTSGASLPPPPLSIPPGFEQPHLPVFSALAPGSPSSPSSLKPLVIISPKMKGDPGCSLEKALGCELPQAAAQSSGLPGPALLPSRAWSW